MRTLLMTKRSDFGRDVSKGEQAPLLNTHLGDTWTALPWDLVTSTHVNLSWQK